MFGMLLFSYIKAFSFVGTSMRLQHIYLPFMSARHYYFVALGDISTFDLDICVPSFKCPLNSCSNLSPRDFGRLPSQFIAHRMHLQWCTFYATLS